MGGGNRFGNSDALHHGFLYEKSESDDAELTGLLTWRNGWTPVHETPARARQLVVGRTYNCGDAEQQDDDCALPDVRLAVFACRAHPWPLWT